MTDYTNSNYLENRKEEYLKLSPAAIDPILSKFGTFDVTGIDDLTNTVQLNYILGSAGIKVSDTEEYPESGQVDPFKGEVKVKWFNGLIELTDLEYKNMSHPFIQAKYTQLLQSMRPRMARRIREWCLNYTNVIKATDPDYDPEWYGFLNNPATGTASNPQFINGSTILDQTAQVLTGAPGNVSIDFIDNTFGAQDVLFLALEDSDTKEMMLDYTDINDLNTPYLILMNHVLAKKFKTLHPTDGTDYMMGTTYKEQTDAAGYSIAASKEVDATIDQTEDGTNEYIMLANPQKNFLLGTVKPMTPQPWEHRWVKRKKIWMQKWNTRYVTVARPYKIGGVYYGAKAHGQFTYKNDV